jgi:hypothetical protein
MKPGMRERTKAGENSLGGPILTALWRYSCDNKKIHEVRFMGEIDFVGKPIVFTLCGETLREPRMPSAGVVG